MLNLPNLPLANVISVYPIHSVTSHSDFTLLSCPSDILTRIGRGLSIPDAINYTSVCTQLFNLRFIDTGFGVLDAQCWRRVPQIHEVISSRSLVPNGREIVERRRVKNDAPVFNTLTLNFEQRITDKELETLITRLYFLIRLQKIAIDCAQLPQIGLFQRGIFRLLEVSTTVMLSLSDLTLSNLSVEVSPPLFRLLSQFSSLQNLVITGNFSTLPPELGQLSQLQNLTITAPNLLMLPPEIVHLSKLKSLTIRENYLLYRPDEIEQLKARGITIYIV